MSLLCEATSTCLLASQGRAMASVSNDETAAIPRPTRLAAASLAPTTRLRSGVVRKVEVIVLKRNSPVITTMPIRRTSTPPEEAAAITLRNPSALSRLAPLGVPILAMASAMLTGTKASAATTLHQNVRVVRSLSSSARIRLFIGVLLRE
jgi:hypothetical protein